MMGRGRGANADDGRPKGIGKCMVGDMWIGQLSSQPAQYCAPKEGEGGGGDETGDRNKSYAREEAVGVMDLG